MNNNELKKVLLIYAGSAEFTAKSFNKWVNNFFELQMMAQVEPYFLFAGTGADITWQLAQDISKLIKEKYKHYNGFVIIHSLDNLIYTSSLVSFMIQKITKPVIFTCVALPGNREKFKKTSEVKHLPLENFELLAFKSNVISCIQMATMDIGEVAVAIGNNLVRAVKAKSNWQDINNYANNFKEDVIARIQFGIQLTTAARKRPNSALHFDLQYDNKVKLLECYPGMVKEPETTNDHGLFIKAYSGQQIPSNWHFSKDLIVYLYSAKESKLAWEVALAKFVWALGQTKDKQKIKKLMSQNLAGEF